MKEWPTIFVRTAEMLWNYLISYPTYGLIPFFSKSSAPSCIPDSTSLNRGRLDNFQSENFWKSQKVSKKNSNYFVNPTALCTKFIWFLATIVLSTDSFADISSFMKAICWMSDPRSWFFVPNSGELVTPSRNFAISGLICLYNYRIDAMRYLIISQL